MDAKIGHVVYSIKPENAGFYKDLAAFLGWETLYEGDDVFDFGAGHDQSIWFGTAIKPAHANDYDGPGLNHIGISVPSIADVDAVIGYLQQKGVPALFETPRHRPDFSTSPDETYYQVMFESPDPLLFEVVYTGPK